MQQKEIRIGLLGFGAMGKTHACAVAALPFFFENLPFRAKIQSVCTRSIEKSEAVAEEYGIKRALTDPLALIRDPDIDVIDICTPNRFHFDAAKEAIAAGKHIYCEKPLCDNASNAEALSTMAASSGKICTVVFNNRHLSAVLQAKRLIESGKIGRILHFDFSYLHDSALDPKKNAGWKQDAALCGKGGVLFDLGSHIIDLAVFLCGPFETVQGKAQIAFPQRKGTNGMPFHTNAPEAFFMTVTAKCGAYGLLTASKLAAGTEDGLSFAIYGTDGALRFSLASPDYLEFFDASANEFTVARGFERIPCTGRYPSPAGKFPSPKAPAGWLRGHIMSMYHFLDAVYSGKQNSPDFTEAAYVQKIMELALASSEDGRERTVK